MTPSAFSRDDKPHYRTYLVFLLATILAFNGIDGAALGLVLPNIKTELLLTDTELGTLTGFAFSLFYSIAGIPIARWADRGDRVKIVAITTALWGMMVMLVGAAQSFAELLIVRVVVAVGEAGCVPAAYSLIGDYFERDARPRAVANYLLGSFFSSILGYLGGGWLSYHYGWRTMFACIGVPSIVVAPIAWWTLSEPRRKKGQLRQRFMSREEPQGVLRGIQVLCRNETFRYLLAAVCVNVFFSAGLGVWEPSFFARSYGVSAERLGLYFAVVYGACGIIGTYSGGYLASRFAPGNERLQLRTIAVFNAFGILSGAIYLSRHPLISLALLGLAIVGGSVVNGPIFASVQTVVPERMRAISIAVTYLFTNLLGAGVGPLIVGALSDALHPYFGADSLRYALLAMSPGCLVSSCLLWRAARSVVADTEAALDARESPGNRCPVGPG